MSTVMRKADQAQCSCQAAGPSPDYLTQERANSRGTESRYSHDSSNGAHTAPLASTNTVATCSPAATCTTLVRELSCAGVLRSVVSPRPSPPLLFPPVAHACSRDCVAHTQQHQDNAREH